MSEQQDPQNAPKEKPIKRGPSFREAPKFTSFIDKLKDTKEASLDKKDDLLKKIPKSIRYLRLSPMQMFGIMMAASGYLTYKALLGKFLILVNNVLE